MGRGPEIRNGGDLKNCAGKTVMLAGMLAATVTLLVLCLAFTVSSAHVMVPLALRLAGVWQ